MSLFVPAAFPPALPAELHGRVVGVRECELAMRAIDVECTIFAEGMPALGSILTKKTLERKIQRGGKGEVVERIMTTRKNL